MGLRLLHLHLHGLFRSHDLELGRDGDTGGQTLYVLELVRSLAKRSEVDQVDVVTRQIVDRKFSADYGRSTEPFGLTLLEAAACGLPMVATDDGGPRDIQARCENGVLADVTDSTALQDALERAGADSKRWTSWSDNGIEAVSRHFSWDAHVCRYLCVMQEVC